MSNDKVEFPPEVEAKIKEYCLDELNHQRKESIYMVGHSEDDYYAMFSDNRSLESRYFRNYMAYLKMITHEFVLEGYTHFFIIYRNGVNNWLVDCIADEKKKACAREICLWLFVLPRDANSKSLELARAVKKADEVVYAESDCFEKTEQLIMKYIDFVFTMYHNPENERITTIARDMAIRKTDGIPNYFLQEMLDKKLPREDNEDSRIIPFDS